MILLNPRLRALALTCLLIPACVACGPAAKEPLKSPVAAADAPLPRVHPPEQAPASPKALRLGAPAHFTFPDLIARAEQLAEEPYQPPPSPSKEVLERIDYDAHGKLKYKTDYALFAQGPGRFPVTFFHLGRYFQVPVHMHLVERKGSAQVAREIEYDESYFEMPQDSPARELPTGSGFAGFRFQESRDGDQSKKPWRQNDWVAFLGATYFRAIGELYQYGISARAIAIDVAEPGGPEEFPVFTDFYIETPSSGAPVIVYGLLQGPSIVGAVRFAMERNHAVTMEINETLFLRRDVARLGIAPLTSMYWFSEKSKGSTAPDWRPEVHDSDGLALWTGRGEWIWRPLNNPKHTAVSAFADDNPRGFGLSQRDRIFDHYLDGVRYERRPSLWVEPLGSWGRGSVQLVEIPTDDEIHDNIVVMWVPERPAQAGARYEVSYRLHWLADEPFPSPLARVVATRIGRGGEPGKQRPQNVQKFVVEMLGGPLAGLAPGQLPEAVLWSSRGTFSQVFTEAVPDDVPGHWRVQFDIAADGTDPVELRLYLRRKEQPLSETWLYQWHPKG